MTHEEAILEKKIAEKTVMETGLNYNYLIVPALEKDFKNFINDYNEKTYSDEDCKKYSSNNQFEVFQMMDDYSINIATRKKPNLN